jgi:iron(III) transport system permease protein
MATVNLPSSAQKNKMGFKLEGRFLLCTLMLAILGLLVLYPVTLLVFNSFVVELPDGEKTLGLGNWQMALLQPGMFQAILNTFKLTIVLELIAFPLGILVAWLMARTDIPGKGVLDFFFWLAFFFPTLPVVMGWILLLDPDFGVINQIAVSLLGLEKGPFNIYSFTGIIFMHLVTKSIAAKYILMTPAFRNLDSAMEEASRIAGVGTLRTLRRIVVPVMAPAILVTLIISLIHTLETFEIELILGPPINFYVYSTKIYQLIYQEPPLFGAATVLGVIVLLTMIPLIIYQHLMTKRRNFTTVTSHFKANVLRLGSMRWPAFALVLFYGLLSTVVPLVFLLMGTFMKLFGFFHIDQPWTLDHWQRVMNDPTLVSSIWNTIQLGGGTAILGVIWFALIAYIIVRTKYTARGVIDFLSWLPVSIPGVILGLGLLWMFLGVPFFRPLYGSVFVLILATVLTRMTTGVQLIKSNMVQLGYELEEASSISGGSWGYTFRRIVLPILMPALLTVAVLNFASASRSIAHIAMLVTNSNRPISMLQLDYAVDGRYEAAAIAGVITVLMSVGVMLLARLVGRNYGIRT